MAKLRPDFNKLKKEKEDTIKYLATLPEGKCAEITGSLNPMTNKTGRANPLECDFFTHPIVHTIKTIPGYTFEVIDWKLSDGYPLNLTVNKAGIVSGLLFIFNDQPDMEKPEPEPMKYDGSNWNNCGRPKGNSFTMNFTANIIFKIVKAAITTTGSSSTNKTLSSGSGSDDSLALGGLSVGVIYKQVVPCSILFNRSHDIDNFVFCKSYLKQRENIIKLPEPLEDGRTEIINKMWFNIGTKYYEFEEFDKFIKDHPGPFGNCDYELDL